MFEFGIEYHPDTLILFAPHYLTSHREYLRLELSYGRRDAACRLQLRAVQQCPGVKSLWCDALRAPLISFVPAPQLLDTIQLMRDKEIRLRHELPDGSEPV